MTAFDIKKVIPITILILVSIAILTAIQPYILGIDVSTLPDALKTLVQGFQHFFKVTPFAVGLAFTWSLFGFLRYYFGDQTTEYEIGKFLETWAWAEGAMLIFATGLPQEYSAALTSIIMAIKSVAGQLQKK